MRILSSALAVIHRQRLDTIAIDDFVSASGVSRGTHYNHFHTTRDLLLALTQSLSGEFVASVEPALQSLGDPVMRLAAGLRLYLRMAVRYPVWGRLLTRGDEPLATRAHPLDEHLLNRLATAAEGKLVIAHPAATRDLVLGAIFCGIESMLNDVSPEDHAEHLTAALLGSMGLSRKKAERLAFAPLPAIDAVDGPLISSLSPPAKAARRRLPVASAKGKGRAAR